MISIVSEIELLSLFGSIVSERRPDNREWKDILPLVKSAINNSHSPQRVRVLQITAMAGIDASSPIKTFYRSNTLTSTSLSDAQHEIVVNVKNLV